MRYFPGVSIIAVSIAIYALGPQQAGAQTATSQSAQLQSAQALEAQAQAAYTAKNYKQAAVLYQKAVPLTPDSQRNADEYNAACSLALDGQKDAAIAALNAAADDGWSDAKQTTSDSDLQSLHDDPKFTALVARLTAAQQMEDKRWGTAGFQSAYSENLSDSDKVAGLSLLWAQARYGFANFWHVPDLDWDATYKSYIPQVLATRSTEDYYKVLTRFYALLKDGHSGVVTPREIATHDLPLTTARIDGKVLVLGTRDASFDMQGLKPGDEIVQINGMAADDYARANVLPYMTSSSPQDLAARTYGWALLTGRPGTVFHLTVATPAGVRSEHSFIVPETVKSSRPAFEYRALPGDVAYVALNEFGDNQDSTGWDAHWAELSQAKTLIIDLRNNGGGDDGVGAHILATLFDKPVEAPKEESPEWIATYRAWGNAQPMMRYPSGMLAPDPARHFTGKVIVLTGPGTFSAAEDTVVLFATSKRGTIIGEPTGGSTGQPLSFSLPGGGSARICTKHDRFPDGREFVGVGVTPDIVVAPTRGDIVKGEDRVLKTAIDVAAKS